MEVPFEAREGEKLTTPEDCILVVAYVGAMSVVFGWATPNGATYTPKMLDGDETELPGGRYRVRVDEVGRNRTVYGAFVKAV